MKSKYSIVYKASFQNYEKQVLKSVKCKLLKVFRFASRAFASASLCASIALGRAWAASSSASFCALIACACALAASDSASLCAFSASDCIRMESSITFPTRWSASSWAFSACSRASFRRLSDVSSNFASSCSFARRASLSLTLLGRTSLRTELETDRTQLLHR